MTVSAKNRWQTLAVLILLSAFALRVREIDSRSVWFDEAVEFQTASVSLGSIPQAVIKSFQPPLYTYVLHAWISLGIEAAWLRFLSVGLSMLTVAGMLVLGRRLLGFRGALVAGAIIAVLPSGIRYAQEVGEYALMECCLVWSLVFLHHTVRAPSWKNWILWATFSALAIYSQYGAVLVIIPLAVITFFDNLWHRRAQAGRQGIAGACVLAATLPLALYFLPRQFPRQASGISINELILLITSIMRLLRAVSDTLLFQLSLHPYSLLPQWPGQIIILSTLVLMFLLGRSASRETRRIFQWFACVFVFYFLAVGTSLYAYRNFGYRYSLIIAPFFVLALAATIERLAQRKQLLFASALFLAVLSIASVQNAVGSRAWPETREDLRSVAICWEQHRNESDPTYVYYGAVPGFAYYRQARALESSNVSEGEWFRSRTTEEKLSSIRETLGGSPRRVWIVFSHVYLDEDQTLLARLSEQYSVDPVCRSLDASAYLLQRH
jgi:uncharacterized membrane protein